jgi:hypothetical protein
LKPSKGSGELSSATFAALGIEQDRLAKVMRAVAMGLF